MKRKKILTAIATAAVLLSFTALIGCAVHPEPESAPDGSTEGDGAPPPENIPADSPESGEPTTREGYLLMLDGAPVTYIENEDTVKDMIEYLIGDHTEFLESLGKTVESVELVSSFELLLTKCDSSDITNAEGAVEKLNASGLKITYAVTEREIKPIAYETVYKNSSSYYEGTKKIQTVGKNGEKQLTYAVTYQGNEESARELTEEKTVTPVTNEVILVGTKKSTASTGSYAWPTKKVYITSYYGWRTINGNREYHYGIDLRAAVGTSIYAADGGKVIYVGTLGTYGKLIQIQHDNGDVTYYAHLSSYSVSKGDRVYKGQLIAKSGATGRVTGPHLHFEIRKNGVRVNPIKYLPKI